jgi:hypothetical protein
LRLELLLPVLWVIAESASRPLFGFGDGKHPQ